MQGKDAQQSLAAGAGGEAARLEVTPNTGSEEQVTSPALASFPTQDLCLHMVRKWAAVKTLEHVTVLHRLMWLCKPEFWWTLWAASAP